MQPLKIEATDSSPRVEFNYTTKVYEITGESRPENASQFYLPILAWLDRFNDFAHELPAESKDVNFKFDMEYMNSISMKFLFEILKKLETLKDKGCTIKVEWYYNQRDEDIKENGEEFATILHVPFQFIPKT